MFPASGVRPNSSVPEVFQALPRFRPADDSRTRPVAVASAEQTVQSSFTAFACAHHQWCHSDRQVECGHSYPLGQFNNA